MKARSQLEGVADLTGKLVDLGLKFAVKELRRTVKDALGIAEHKARASMPQGDVPHFTYRGRLVSPGYALSTLHIETTINKQRGAAIAFLGVGREAFYAVQFVELGTAHMQAQPWLRPSFESSEDPMLQQITVGLREGIKRTAKSQARAAQRGRLARR